MNAKTIASAKPIAPANVEIQTLRVSELLLLLCAAAGGALAAAVVMPIWLPGLTQSLLGAEPKAFWYLARASGVVAYGLLWLTMVFGMVVSNKMARLWNGGPTAIELHQFLTWLAIAFGLFHALILMGDTYIRTTLWQVLTPFAYADYEPFWVGIGQIAFYLVLLIGLSVYVRKRLGYRTWRLLHHASGIAFLALTAHGILAGTDTLQPAILGMYLVAGVSVYFLLVVRIFSAIRLAKTVSHAPAKSTAHPSARR